MSAQFPSDFDQQDSLGIAANSTGPGSLAAAAASAGYGQGYGGDTAGESEHNVLHYLQVLYRRRYIATAAFLVVFLGASLYTLTATRIYESTVRILIERDNPKVVSFQEVIDPGEITDDYYETQYRILQSRVLARRTIDAMDLWTHPEFN